MRINKNTKMCIGVIILIVVVVLVVQNKDKLVRRNDTVENFNSPGPSNSNNSSNNQISLDDIQEQLEALQNGN